ncbi:MAG: sigma-54 dependent transcriptional regulator [Kofleriaceae bacterium]
MDPDADQLADVLIVDDDRTIRETLARALGQAGLTTRVASGLGDARPQLDGVKAVLLDIRLRDGDGLTFLAELRASHPRLPIIMATSFGDSERTIVAMKSGAFDYLTKPFDIDQMVATLRRALKAPPVAAPPAAEPPSATLVGSSARMLAVWKSIGRAATSDVPVLITGESGTGKELVARAIHDHGSRKGAPFVAVNIAALAPTLVESELFGYEKGAFTNATERRAGRFEVANSGTLFLDEIGDLELAMQTKLLRVLQDGSFERVGATTPVVSNARVIAATSKPVRPGDERTRLREDLYYRLGVLQIDLPPLRERRSDIPLLVQSVLARLSKTLRRAVSEAAMARLQAYAWPGNVRELVHVLERASVMSTREILDEADLALPEATRELLDDGDLDLHRNVYALEKSLVERALARANGNRAEAARSLGIARTQLYAKMRDLGLKV